MTVATRVTIVVGGHLAACPRMLKVAVALDEAGYRVRVVSSRSLPWATAADRALRARRRWDWTEIPCEPGARVRLQSAVRVRLATRLVRALGVERAPLAAVARAQSRLYPELARAAAAEPTDLIYAGTGVALAAAAHAAARLGVPFALDLEDLHGDEQEPTEEGRFVDAMALRLARVVLPRAAFLTAGSGPIADAYAARHGVRAIPVDNAFPLPASAPQIALSDDGVLRLVWFSQTVGPHRGLEDSVRALGAADVNASLFLRGAPVNGYLDGLRRLAGQVAPRLRIDHGPPIACDSPVELCRGFDVGLAVEAGHIGNRALCLTNKALTYPLAGLAVAFTDTPGQRGLARDLGEGALLAAPGDVATLGAGLRRWALDRERLGRARRAAWDRARDRWHWEHPLARGAVLDAVAGALRR